MARILKCAAVVLLLMAVFVWPAWAQAQNPGPQKNRASAVPDKNQEAANDNESIYVPPGPVKSVEIGNFYLRKKDYKGALSRFKEAVSENSMYAPAYLGMGKVYEHMGLKEKALDAYRHYLDALPSTKDAEEAKKVQSAVARLEHQLRKRKSAGHSGVPKAEATSQLR